MLPLSMLVGMSALAMGTQAQTSSTTSAAALSSAQSAATITSSTASSSSSSSAAATHTIAVGASGFKFQPNSISNVSVGDYIEWRFYPTGHWVVRAEYEEPCIPYEDTGPNKVGFSSGEVDVATTSDDGPRFRVRVNDTSPIFFYCAAPGSCTNYYMVGVINPNSTQTLDNQIAFAKNATFQMTPGEAFPSETAAASGSTSTSAAPSSTASSNHSSSHHLSAGAIAGIAIGAAAVVIIAITLIYLCGRRGGMDKAYNRQSRGNRDTLPGPMVGPMVGPMAGSMAGPMVGARYGGPKSPGQETFSTTAYTATPSNDPYGPPPGQQMPAYGAMPAQYPISSGSPPPVSEYSQTSIHHQQGYGSPGMDGNNTSQTGFFSMPQQTSQNHPNLLSHSPPIELPGSLDPENSGFPNSQRTFSWANSGEGIYRPSK